MNPERVPLSFPGRGGDAEKIPDASKLKEEFFHRIIAEKMVDTYEKEMASFGFSKEEVSLFREKVLSLKTELEEYLYAFPWELKQRALPSFLKKIRDGKESIDSMVDKIVEASKINHRKIAFHASNDLVVPKEEFSNGQKIKSWVVYGKEKDHRDADLPMAYYSFDYGNLYRTKNPKYIYVVSIQEHENFGNRKDGNNEWGRAPSLSVIEKLDLREIETEARTLVEPNRKAIDSNEVDGLAA